MKTVGKTLGIYLVVVIIIGIILGLTNAVSSIHGPLQGFAYALGFSFRIFYVTIPLLVGLYFILRRSSKVSKKEESK